MIIKYNNLYRKMIETGISYANLADIIGVNEDDVILKMQGLMPWLLSEAILLCSYFNVVDVKFLFLQLDTNT